jgi:hypothetical protein
MSIAGNYLHRSTRPASTHRRGTLACALHFGHGHHHRPL